jgi:hypothetical protein
VRNDRDAPPRRASRRQRRTPPWGNDHGRIAVGENLQGYVGEGTRGMRGRAAAGLQTVEEKAGQVLEHSGKSLRHAKEFLEDTRAHVTDALRAGPECDSPQTVGD